MSTAVANTSRGSSWSDNEVRALIAIWGEDNIQEELDGAVRNKVILNFDDIAMKMRQKGYERDWQQCRTKVKNLKKDYKKRFIGKYLFVLLYVWGLSMRTACTIA